MVIGLPTASIGKNIIFKKTLFLKKITLKIKKLVFITLINRRNNSYLKLTTKNFKKETDVEMFISILIELIEGRE